MTTYPDIYEWQLTTVLADQQAMFLLWTIDSLFCTSKDDFQRHYEFAEGELEIALERLVTMGFLQEDGEEFVLTEQGRHALSFMRPPHPQINLEQLARPEADIHARFSLPAEYTYVEERLLEQLQSRSMGWTYQEKTDPEQSQLDFEGRQKYSDVLLTTHLKAALREINREQGIPDLTEAQLEEAIRDLEHVEGTGLLEINENARKLLVEGTYVSAHPGYPGGAQRHVNFLHLKEPHKNDFRVLRQFHVALPGRDTFIIPDLVLFVNGIPLVVIECKSPALTEPIEEGVAQLKRYASRNTGVPALFYFNVFQVVTCYYTATLGTIESESEDYQQWKDPYPLTRSALAQELKVENPQNLSSQQLLVAGTLQKDNLLDLLHNFVIFRSQGARKAKVIARYQQFRAVKKAIQRLQHGHLMTPETNDERGGIVWHTQGSGKSLTMVFLIRKMRTLPILSQFKIVAVTDRQDLQDQLRQTMNATEQEIEVARDIPHARGLLRRQSSDIAFVMIQKARGDMLDEEETDLPELRVQNDSPNILLMVDEAHRSHTSKLHLNLATALRYASKIGFTGTPIMVGAKKRTENIFGPIFDTYTILEAERDGATVPILYEGYQAYSTVTADQQLDHDYLYLTQALPNLVQLRLMSSYANESAILEARELIEAKARHMLLHYAANILPNGFKAMIVASSRAATVRYQAAIMLAKKQLLETLDQLPPAKLALSEDERAALPLGEQMLLLAHAQRERLRLLDCAAVISSEPTDDPTWRQWSQEQHRNEYIRRFKLPLEATQANRGGQDQLALLCVQQMLLTGFDAPVVQALYLDRRLDKHNLLQAIARVNRTHPDKTYGIVVDYLGVARQLKDALAVYTANEIRGAYSDIRDEILKLQARSLRIRALFSEHNIEINSINLKRDQAIIDACLNLCKDPRFRADFEEKLKKFLESMDAVLPRPEAQDHLKEAEVLGYIHKCAANVFPEEKISLKGIGKKVRALIDDHITVLGISQTVAPISITDPNFEQKIDQHTSDETKAAQMEHLARYYIRERYDENPVYYDRLSQRLEAILKELQGQWAAQVQRLLPFIQELKQGRQSDATGLDPRRELPFLDILEAEVCQESAHFATPASLDGEKTEQLSEEQRKELAELTLKIIQQIRQQTGIIRDFWRKPVTRRTLLAWVINFLDERDLVPYERQKEVANRLLELAERLDELNLL